MRNAQLDTNEFWIVGDFAARTFARWGGVHHWCYIDCSDPTEAEQYGSYREALKACCHDEDLLEWKRHQHDPKAVKPLRCRVQVAVYPPGTRP